MDLYDNHMRGILQINTDDSREQGHGINHSIATTSSANPNNSSANPNNGSAYYDSSAGQNSHSQHRSHRQDMEPYLQALQFNGDTSDSVNHSLRRSMNLMERELMERKPDFSARISNSEGTNLSVLNNNSAMEINLMATTSMSRITEHHHHNHHHHHHHHHHQHHGDNNQISAGSSSLPSPSPSTGTGTVDPILRSKIVAHPIYPRLVLAYLNCNKIGAPPDIATKLDELTKKYHNFGSNSPSGSITDPELDHFMEAYCNVLQRYEEELMQPFKEAMAFCRKIELQVNALSKGTAATTTTTNPNPNRLSQSGEELADEWRVADDNMNNNNNSNDNIQENHYQENDGNNSEDYSGGDPEIDEQAMAGAGDEEEGGGHAGGGSDPVAEDTKLREQLRRKYSSYIWSLKQEFLKKKKKGKLPKEARASLLHWWALHYKWPYPSEGEKAALAEATGLDQKQINNWFINQRKRHWKPSEDMSAQYVMVEQETHGGGVIGPSSSSFLMDSSTLMIPDVMQ